MAETKPTAAAMRAAERICRLVKVNTGMDATAEVVFRNKFIAELIDAETGLPELVEACKVAVHHLKHWDDSPTWGETMNRLNAALARAEGRQTNDPPANP